MPIYEYRCKKCKKEFEELVMSSSEKIACPKCRSKKVGRLMSKVSFRSSDGSVSMAGESNCSGCNSGNCSTCG